MGPALWMIEGARALGAGVHQGAGEVQGHALPVRIHPTRVGSEVRAQTQANVIYIHPTRVGSEKGRTAVRP